MLRFPTIDGPLRRFFAWYANYLVQYWYLFVLWPLLLSIVLTTGILRFNELRELDARYLYTPDNAPSWTEEEILNQHWPLQTNRFLPGRSFNFKHFIAVIITGKCQEQGECDLLSDPIILDEISRLDNYVAQNVTVKTSNNTELRFKDVCLGWDGCYRVGGPDGLLELLKRRDFFESRGIVITYPRANTDGNPVYLAFNLGGVTTHPNNGSIITVNAIKLMFFLRSDDDKYARLSSAFEDSAEKYLRAFHSDLLNVYFFHSRSVDNGLAENASQLAPKFVITFVVLLTMATVCVLKWTENKGVIPFKLDMVKSKPFLAGSGILTALMAIVSGIGLLLLSGMKWPELAVIVPFLVISIGIDDMFIMAAAWDNSDPRGTVRVRMQSAMSEAAVAISITSITDALSFAVGCVTHIPSVRGFCMIAAVCIAFNYLYQITFFAGLMVLTGWWEVEGRNFIAPCCIKREQPVKDTQLQEIKTQPKETPISDKQQNGTAVTRTDSVLSRTDKDFSASFFQNIYGPLILHPVTKVIVLVVFLMYMGVAIYGCLNIVEGLDYDKLLLRSNPTVAFIEKDTYYFDNGPQVEIVVSNAPSLVSVENRTRIEEMVQDFESSSHAIKNSTQFWLREYIKFQEWSGVQMQPIPCCEGDVCETREKRQLDYDYDYEDDGFDVPDDDDGMKPASVCLSLEDQQTEIDTRELWVNKIYDWMRRFSFHKLWSQDVVWQNAKDPENRSISTFRFRLGLNSFFDANDVKHGTLELRAICEKYPHFNVTTYQLYRQIADQINQIAPNTLQNVGIALLCMVVVALIFIPIPICTVFIVLAIISIDLGVVGYMTLWNVNLDPISMITIIMSIGFSVDFSAHITYGYVSSDPSFTAAQKTVSAMQRLAWPVFQGAMSTVLGVTVLAFVDSYMVVVFFKTIFLVIIFGTVHALVFLPVLLSSVMPLVERLCSKESKSSS